MGLVQCTSEHVATEELAKESSNIEWKTAVPVMAEAHQNVEAIGKWDMPEGGMHTIAFASAVQVVDYSVAPGSAVRKGQVLAYVAHPELVQIQKSYLDAKAEFEANSAQFQQYQDLHSAGRLSVNEWRQAQRAHQLSENTLSAAENALQLYGLDASDVQRIQARVPVKSPATGHVQNFATSVGAFLAPEQALTTVVEESKARVQLQVVAAQAIWVKTGEEATLDYAGKAFTGTVQEVGHSVDLNGMVPLWIAVDEAPSNWLDGAPVHVEYAIHLGTHWSVPVSAVLFAGDQAFVIVKEGDQFSQHNITILSRDEQYAYIQGDALSDQKVVVEHANRAAAMVE